MTTIKKTVKTSGMIMHKSGEYTMLTCSH